MPGANSNGERKRTILSRLLKYADQHYRVREDLESVTDRRVRAPIATMRVVAGLFLMVSARLGSLNRIENALRGPGAPGKRWCEWLGGPLPSADRLGEVAALLKLEDLRGALLKHHCRRKRNKTLPPLPGKLRVLILDAHEMWTSYRRCCPGCSSRQVQYKDEVRTQYYLRYVTACLMNPTGPVLLDLEFQRPGEGEIAAAQRLVERLLKNSPRAFNVVAGDALYLDPTLCRFILDHHRDFIAVLKNENRDLIQDFRGLLDLDAATALHFEFNGKQCLCHDLEGFTSWTQLGGAVRVIRSLESSTVRRQLTGQSEELSSEWLWATSLPKAKASTYTIVQIGHGRWGIENQGFNELVHSWHADHVYHLNLTAITATLLLLFLAYNVFHVWLARGLKPALRDKHAPDYFVQQLHAEFYAALLRPG